VCQVCLGFNKLEVVLRPMAALLLRGGLPSSPDLKAAREVADFLGTDHHEFTFTVQVRGDIWFLALFPGTGWCDWDSLVCQLCSGSTN
jgi:hypothetical protein